MVTAVRTDNQMAIVAPRLRVRAGFVEGPTLRRVIDRRRGAVALMAENGKLYEVFADGAVATQSIGSMVGETTDEQLKQYSAYFGLPVVAATQRYLGFNGPDAKKRGLTRQTGVVTFYPDGSFERFWGMGQFISKEEPSDTT